MKWRARMKQHTKAPWKLVAHGTRIVSDASSCTVVRTAIAETQDDEPIETVRRWWADAHLIRGAPELLAELENRFAQTRCGCGHPHCRRCEDDRDTEKVIARAYGEEDVTDD